VTIKVAACLLPAELRTPHSQYYRQQPSCIHSAQVVDTFSASYIM